MENEWASDNDDGYGGKGYDFFVKLYSVRKARRRRFRSYYNFAHTRDARSSRTHDNHDAGQKLAALVATYDDDVPCAPLPRAARECVHKLPCETHH